MGGITVWIKNRFLAGRCLKGIQITARDIPLKPIKQADISSDIQHFVETDVTLGIFVVLICIVDSGNHNRPSLSGPSIPCPRVETRDRHEAPLPVKTETGVLKKKGRQNNRYIGVLHRAGRNTPRTECPDKAKWFCSMSGHKRSLRAGPGSGGIYIFGSTSSLFRLTLVLKP